MSKEFTVTGKCIPTQHYMADVSGEYADVMDMIKKGRYFIINRQLDGMGVGNNSKSDRL
jgi:hypothetical protein